MKKYIYIILGIVIIAIIGILILIPKDNEEIIIANSDFYYMGPFDERITDTENYILSNYEEYTTMFGNDTITEKDFQNNNYLLVTISYDSCSENNITPTDYKIKGNTIDILVKYEASCGVCPPEYMYYLLKIDKDMNYADVNIEYKAVNKANCDPNVSYKPIIYLYPETETNVSVKLGCPELLTTTYPKYNNEWNVIAKPNGEIIDSQGRTYYGLYWEGINNIQDNFKDGFVVSREDTTSFLEEKLEILGLTEREANEFIIYWLPKLEENEYNQIRFESIDQINEQMPLDIKPAPDTLIRVFMEYKPIDKQIDIEEQKLTSQGRYGFTVVEWGGSLIKSN